METYLLFCTCVVLMDVCAHVHLFLLSYLKKQMQWKLKAKHRNIYAIRLRRKQVRQCNSIWVWLIVSAVIELFNKTNSVWYGMCNKWCSEDGKQCKFNSIIFIDFQNKYLWLHAPEHLPHEKTYLKHFCETFVNSLE